MSLKIQKKNALAPFCRRFYEKYRPSNVEGIFFAHNVTKSNSQRIKGRKKNFNRNKEEEIMKKVMLGIICILMAAMFTLGAAGLGDAEKRQIYFFLALVLAIAVTVAGIVLRKKFVRR